MKIKHISDRVQYPRDWKTLVIMIDSSRTAVVQCKDSCTDSDSQLVDSCSDIYSQQFENGLEFGTASGIATVMDEENWFTRPWY